MTPFLLIGRGDDGQLYVNRYNPTLNAWSGPLPLPGKVAVLSFTGSGGGQRVDLYALSQKLSAVHWWTSDGGATWSGPADLGGAYTSNLIALGPGA